jgi:hypothetical protein
MYSKKQSIDRRVMVSILVCVPVLLLFGSCARMAVFSDAAMKERTAVRVYPSTPYLLVVRTGTTEKPYEVSVVHLPDLHNPQFIRFYSGLGSQKSKIDMSNGVLTSLGFEADSQIPQTIGAVAGLAKEVAGIAAKAGVGGATREPPFDLYKVVALKDGRVTLVRVTTDGSQTGK